jgi:hypothetical protein
MKNIDEVVSKVDIFAQPLEINFEPDRKHGIYLPFVATLALVVIISASTISSLVDLFSYKKVSLTGYRELVTGLLYSSHKQIQSTQPYR